MKLFFLSPPLISIALLVSGCQSTPNNESGHLSAKSSDNIASPLDINQALLSDESIDVIHPVADVDISLTDETSLNQDDIWYVIRDNLTFDIPQNKQVVAQRNWYAKHPDYLNRISKRAKPFMYYIVQELEKNNMPIEMALLPIVESAFDPFAYSHGRASGMWQFVPGTGERFGMKQNWWYDGRRDVIASTQGAIKYLQYLHKFFDGDWLLALAAYNSGEGRVQRAVRNNKKKNMPTDFWSLSLPRETRDYVPKLLALADIIKRPDDFNMSILPIENKQVISEIDVGSQIDLAKAASLANLSLAEFQRLNPGFNRWSTDPEGPHRLVVPTNKEAQFIAGLNQLSEKERLAWTRYKIKNGDSLGKISKEFNTSIELIQNVNNVKGSQIIAGKYLLIPVAAQSLDSYILSKSQRLSATQNSQRKGLKTIHTVRSGDNLWDISRKYKVSTKSIAKWNGMAPKDYIKPGQKLVIWTDSSATGSNATNSAMIKKITYKVRRGDSFARIANKFNVSISDIERWNGISRKNYIQPGQLLKLSVNVSNNS